MEFLIPFMLVLSLSLIVCIAKSGSAPDSDTRAFWQLCTSVCIIGLSIAVFFLVVGD